MAEEIDMAKADEKNARLALKLNARSGFSSSETHSVSANQWSEILMICADAETRRVMTAAPDLLAALEKAADWFEQYAVEHYAKAKTAPGYGEQHSRETKGKTNRDRANELRAVIAKARGQ